MEVGVLSFVLLLTMPIDKLVIQKYLQGTATPEEVAQMKAYLLDEDPDLSTFLEVLDASWTGLPDRPPVDGLTTERILSRLKEQLFERRRPVISLGFRIAAAILIPVIAATTFFLYYQSHKPAERQQLAQNNRKVLVNRDNRMKKATLPDRSQVWLSPNSELSWSPDFNVKDRAVSIKGEAFFDVAPVAQLPFRVTSAGVTIEVLGTAFNVEAYEQEASIRVSLVKGKVAVEKQVLTAGQLFTYYKEGATTAIQPLKIKDATAWTRGGLVLNDIEMDAALERVAQRYHLQLSYGKNVRLAGRRVSGSFKEDEPLDQVLDILLFISKYTYRINGHQLEILDKH